MPTPFNHLALAETVLTDPRLPRKVARQLQAERPAFLLGNTAPDLATVSGSPRRTTHFFDVPMTDRRPAHLRLLEAYPQLRDPRALAPAHAAFLGGYLAHLWLDQAWIATVFEPTFGPHVRRSDFRQRLIDHNLLRAHLDQQERPHLLPDLGVTLRMASPDHWLPFAPDANLCRWRDRLANQLEPGGRSQTVAVFATRLGLSPEAFAARLGSQAEMERAVFRHVSQRRLGAFRRLGLTRTVELVGAYLQGQIHRAQAVNSPFPLKANPRHNPHGVQYASH